MENKRPTNITLITGVAGTGKTTLANKLSKGKRTVHMHESEMNRYFWTRNIEIDTECVVITMYRGHCIKEILEAFSTQQLLVNIQSEESFIIKTPELIIDCDTVDIAKLSHLLHSTQVKHIHLKGGFNHKLLK
tara:strand:+ start:2660 stop:3058 length:399 start_codon:yes stop_codon:yes gene_type:complete